MWAFFYVECILYLLWTLLVFFAPFRLPGTSEKKAKLSTKIATAGRICVLYSLFLLLLFSS
jgi:hypothetical protein